MKRGFVSRFSKALKNRIETLHVADLQDKLPRRGQLGQFRRISGVFRDRFFDQQMLAPVQQFVRDVEMRVRRGRDRGGVHLFRKLFKVSGGQHAKFLRETARRGRIRVENGRELFGGKLGIKARVVLPNVPDADNTNPKRFHFASVLRAVLQKPFVGPFDSFAQPDGMPPTQIVQFRDVEKFPRCPVGFGRVPGQLALESNDLANQFRQFADGDVFAATHVDDLSAVIFLEQEDASRGQIVHMEKFPPRFSRAPDDHLAVALLFGFVRFAQKRRQDMGREQVEIIVRPVEIRRHGRDEIRAVFARVGLAKFDSGDLGDGVGLVGRLERAGQERSFRNRLRRVLRINAGAAEKQEFAHTRFVRRVDDVVLDLQVIEQEFHRQIVVRLDAAHFGGREDDQGRLLLREKTIDVRFISQIELGAIAESQVGESLVPEFADERAADQASMTGDEYFV